ncbi:hypothetical protein APHAL10511_008216 [Amanita phalloides]|nr:hypothetical protein APHAL10511_008216 [Amanita phalloides]
MNLQSTRQSSRTRFSAFSLDEFEQLVSVALDLNSDRFPDGTLALAFSPESASSCPFLSSKSGDNARSPHIYFPGASSARPLRQQHLTPGQMHPPLDSIDFGRVSCVPGLGCAQSSASSTSSFVGLRRDSVPTITLTTPPSPSKTRLVDKIRRGASAFVARTRTLSSPVKLSSQTRKPPPLPTQHTLNPDNPDFRPIPTISITAAFKNNIQLRSTVSLLDLEWFNNNSACSLATNTADFYDDESDFVPYLPLACQYERAFPKSPSAPSLLGARPDIAERPLATLAKGSPRRSRGKTSPSPSCSGSGGNRTARNRCVSSGHLQHRNSRTESRRRTLSASSVNSASDSASPVTPRSGAFKATVCAAQSGPSQDPERDGSSSFISFDSEESEDEKIGNGVDGSIAKEQRSAYDDQADPFAKGSVQIVRTKSRAKPTFQLYNPNLIIGPGSAGEPVTISNARTELSNKASRTTIHHDVTSDSTSTSGALHKYRYPQTRGGGKRRTPRSSLSPTPISRMRKTPVVFPLMPGETQEDRNREEERMARQRSTEEWTLCLGKRDVPGSGQSESEVEKEAEQSTYESAEESMKAEEGELEQEEERDIDREVESTNNIPNIDSERGRRKSIPQLRVTHFIDSEAESTSGEEGYVTGNDWTLMLPLYNVPKDPLLAQSGRRSRRSSRSPSPRHVEHRRRAISCTSITPSVATIRINQPPPRSDVSVDEITLLGHGPEILESTSPSRSKPGTSPIQNGDRLTPPGSSCSGLSVVASASRSSYCSNGPADARASMISLSSHTTSSTATVVPGPWQREQMIQKGDWPPSFQPRLSEDAEESTSQWEGDRERRMSAFSTRTMSSVHSNMDYYDVGAHGPSPMGGLRKSIVVSRAPLPFGREAEVRARTVSTGGSRIGVGRWMAGSPAPSFSPLSWEWRESGLDKGKEREQEREQEQEREKEKEEEELEKDGSKRDSMLSVTGQWLAVSGREGSVQSVGSFDGRGRRADGHCCNESVDDGASGCSGTYYSARSSFSFST